MIIQCAPRARLPAAIAAATLLVALPQAANAASSKGCDGGGFTVSVGGTTLRPPSDSSIPFSTLDQPGALINVTGKYVTFKVVAGTLGIRDYTFTGAPNPLDMTGGKVTPVWAEKTPDHRGLSLAGGKALVELDKENIELSRSKSGLTMKIQAKDCANGGVFQMEVERADRGTTRFTHVLVPGVFYYDNPNFRAREGDKVPFDAGQDGIDVQILTVGARINIGKDGSPKLVGRDSPQVATRVLPPSGQCVNMIPTRPTIGNPATVLHCGRVSQWDVASGGRMGWVTGEDATEVAPPATNCVSKCQAQNRVRGGAVVLGSPASVPVANRLKPDFPTP